MSGAVELADGVRRDDAAGRYELVVDGDVVAFTEFSPAGEGVDLFPHTVTAPQHRGNGYARRLVKVAMDDEKARGRRVIAACWFVAEFLDGETGYGDLRAG